jgi:hypothetical protein
MYEEGERKKNEEKKKKKKKVKKKLKDYKEYDENLKINERRRDRKNMSESKS